MSCKICERLLNVPSDKKEKVMLFDYKDDVIDADYFHGYMELDHFDDGDPYAFIKFELRITSTGRAYERVQIIKYCPCCGQKLYNNKYEEKQDETTTEKKSL